MVGKQDDGGTVTTGTNTPAYTAAISSTQSSHNTRCSAALPPEDPQPGPSTPVISTKDEVIVETSDGGLVSINRHWAKLLFHMRVPCNPRDHFFSVFTQSMSVSGWVALLSRSVSRHIFRIKIKPSEVKFWIIITPITQTWTNELPRFLWEHLSISK